MKRSFFVVLGFLLGVSTGFGGPMVSTSGSWTLTLTAAEFDQANTPGRTFFSSYDNINNPGTGGPTTVSAQTGGGPWTIYAAKTDTLWPSGVSLIASVYSPTTNPPIQVNYGAKTLTGTAQALYQTTTTAAVTIRYQVSGILIQNLYAASFSTTVSYTVTSP